jgi:hypothetical protein
MRLQRVAPLTNNDALRLIFQDSPCNKRHQNVFTSCYGRHPSDEHLSIVDAGVKRREWRDAASGEQSDGEGGFTPRPRSAIGWSGSSRDIHYNKRYTWVRRTSIEGKYSFIPGQSSKCDNNVFIHWRTRRVILTSRSPLPPPSLVRDVLRPPHALRPNATPPPPSTKCLGNT